MPAVIGVHFIDCCVWLEASLHNKETGPALYWSDACKRAVHCMRRALGCPNPVEPVTSSRHCAAEAVGTFIATYVVLEIACNPRSKVGANAPLVVGATFGALLVVLAPFSSGSLNPARSLGPAAISSKAQDLWIWVFGPVVGALLAAPVHLWFALVPAGNMSTKALAHRQASEPVTDDISDESPAVPGGRRAADKRSGDMSGVLYAPGPGSGDAGSPRQSIGAMGVHALPASAHARKAPAAPASGVTYTHGNANEAQLPQAHEPVERV